MNEYIIINKTALKKRLKEYKETPVTLGSRISELELILAQSTPLTPVVEDAYNAGKIHNDLSVAGFDNPQGRYVSNLKLEI